MMPDRWAQIKTVMAQALDTPADERASLLDRTCGADQELRREVESLLAAAEASDSLPEARGAIAVAAKALGADHEMDVRSILEIALGRQYDIVQPLGRGGMGHVYLARERELERFVAIKVLRPRSEEHTSELQSPYDLVCRLLLEKKKRKSKTTEMRHA